MFRLHATFLSDAEFLVIFPELSEPEVPFLPRLNVELILLNAMKATGGFCLYALAFPPDPTLRWYIPRARNCVPLRCPRYLSRANNACVGTAVWEGMLVRLAGRRLKVLSLSRASHRLCSWVGAFIPDAAAKTFPPLRSRSGSPRRAGKTGTRIPFPPAAASH